MARKPIDHTAAHAPETGHGNADASGANAPMVLKYGDNYTIAVDKLSPKSLAYLLQNGFSQSLTDAAAFTKEQKAGKSEAEITAMAKAKRDARFEAILNGTVGVRVAGGPKLPQIDRVMRTVATERVNAVAKARNITLPKGDALKGIVDKFLAKNEADVRAEAQRRIDSVGGAGDVDDLFEGIKSAPATA